ncbi:hypothetical protein ACFXTH_014295 [Malus domestica]
MLWAIQSRSQATAFTPPPGRPSSELWFVLRRLSSPAVTNEKLKSEESVRSYSQSIEEGDRTSVSTSRLLRAALNLHMVTVEPMVDCRMWVMSSKPSSITIMTSTRIQAKISPSAPSSPKLSSTPLLFRHYPR